MAEHGRGSGGRHAAPGDARPGADAGPGPGATATVEAGGTAAAAPTAPFASTAGPTTGRPGAGPEGRTATGPDVGTPEPAATTSAVGTPDDPDDEDRADPVRGTGWVLLVGGLVGAVVALVLLIEKLDLLANPNYIPSCSIDPVLSCGTIMKTAQAAVLGFPNPVIGLLTFPVVAACGAIVLSGAELPRWVWWALEIGSFAGVLFIHWLIVQSLVVIHALCPYCMVAWVAVIAIFWFTTMHNLREGNLGGDPAGDTLVRRHGWGLAAWYVLIVVAIVASFPAYFGAMVGLG
jgi:uncharacterized membrane protein